MRRILGILLAALMAGSLLAGCSGKGGDTSDGERPTLRLFIINGNYSEGATKDSVWKAIEDAADVNIEISGMVNSDDYYRRRMAREILLSGVADKCCKKGRQSRGLRRSAGER